MQTSLKQQPKSKEQRLLMRIWQDRVLYLLLAPAMLYFVFFRLWPIWNMRLAFFNYKARSEWTWAGLKWFEIIFSSNGFFTILGNTLRISFMKYVLMFPFSVAFAILLNELRSSRMRKLVQVSTYLPHFLSWVVIAGIFINILSPTGGILNDFRALFGLPAVDYMTQKDTIMGVLFASSLWRSLGWDSIIYFAAIIGINQSLYEAAYMDGATRMQVIRYVVLPALITPMVTTFILNLGFFLDAGFDQVFNFTNDAVNSTIDILDTYIYRLGPDSGSVRGLHCRGPAQGRRGRRAGAHYPRGVQEAHRHGRVVRKEGAENDSWQKTLFFRPGVAERVLPAHRADGGGAGHQSGGPLLRQRQGRAADARILPVAFRPHAAELSGGVLQPAHPALAVE